MLNISPRIITSQLNFPGLPGYKKKKGNGFIHSETESSRIAIFMFCRRVNILFGHNYFISSNITLEIFWLFVSKLRFCGLWKYGIISGTISKFVLISTFHIKKHLKYYYFCILVSCLFLSLSLPISLKERQQKKANFNILSCM